MAEIVVTLVNGELAGRTMQSLKKDIGLASREVDKAKIGTLEWVKANEKLEKAKGLHADLKKQIEGTASASDLLKKAWNNLPGAAYFNQIGQSFSMAKQGVGGLISSMGALKGAIISTGIGALVVLVATLFTWFTKTETGGDLLAKVMAALDAVFRQVTESIDRLVKGDIIGFFKGMTTEMVDQTTAAAALADALDELEERESAFQVVQKAGLRDKAELLKMSKEEIRSLQERIAAIDKAGAISRGLNQMELENQREHLKIISGGTAAITDELIKRLEKTGLTQANAKDFFYKGNITQEDLDEANEGLAKFLEIQERAFNEERELLVMRNKLNKKERKEDSDAKKKALAAEQKDLKEFLDAQENLRKLANEKKLAEMDNDRLREIEKINQAAEEKILAVQGTEAQMFEQIKLIRELQAIDLNNLEQKYEDKRIAAHKAYLDKLNADSEAWADEQIRLDQERADFALAMDEVRMGSAQTVTAFLAEMLAKQIGDERAAKAIKKIAGIVDVGINLLKEKASNAATAAANPLNAVTFGAAGAAQLITLNQAANIRAAVATARILAFKKGGIPSGVLRGRSHAQGGIPLVAEGNEIILTKGVFQNAGLRAMASAINVAGGGRSFASGGVPMPSSPYKDRAPVPSGRAGAPGGDPFTAGINRLIERMDEYQEATDRRIDRIKVTNNLQDTQKGLQLLQQLKDEADV